MNLDSLARLQEPAGQEALAQSMALAPDESSFLRCFNRLSRHFDPILARAALQTALLRKRARVKFSRAESMFFEREALEQASSELVAAYRARHFTGRVADLCCGLGGDAIALAGRGPVLAVDLDPLRVQLCRLNLLAYDRLEAVTLLEGDALKVPWVDVEGVFIDPDRRPEGQRQLSVLACRPTLNEILAHAPAEVLVGIKLAPGVPWHEIHSLGNVEFISWRGELKECVLWRSSAQNAKRQATLLPGEHILSADQPAEPPGTSSVRRFVYDPDPAVIRAGLVTDLARILDAYMLDERIAYLTSDHSAATPFARVWEVEEHFPFHLRRLREFLRERGVGRLQIQRRGSAVDPAELIRKLKLAGEGMRTLILTRVEAQPWTIVARERSQ
jgi:SAM-dependent methyltransferase